MSECEVSWPGGVKAHHSDDLTEVYAGDTTPYLFCGFHATYYLPEAIRAARANRATVEG